MLQKAERSLGCSLPLFSVPQSCMRESISATAGRFAFHNGISIDSSIAEPGECDTRLAEVCLRRSLVCLCHQAEKPKPKYRDVNDILEAL
jgi:hypothetical protein